MKRLYVAVRADLPVGLQMAQACHAAYGFARANPDLDVGENLVVLHAKSEGELLRMWVNHDGHGFAFFEPDLNNEYTAIALDGSARKLLSSLPLALRQT